MSTILKRLSVSIPADLEMDLDILNVKALNKIRNTSK